MWPSRGHSLAQSNVNLVLELVESVTQEVTDAVAAWLHTPTTAELPGIASGGVTSSSTS